MILLSSSSPWQSLSIRPLWQHCPFLYLHSHPFLPSFLPPFCSNGDTTALFSTSPYSLPSMVERREQTRSQTGPDRGQTGAKRGQTCVGRSSNGEDERLSPQNMAIFLFLIINFDFKVGKSLLNSLNQTPKTCTPKKLQKQRI